MNAGETPATLVAIVTGAARGIGAAIATRLAEDGLDVAVLDLEGAACAQTVQAVRERGRRGLAVGCDVADESAVGEAVARVAADLGPPTVLVNNAGIIRNRALARIEVQEWDAVLMVHLRGSFLMCREVTRHMRQAMWGRIVNLSSTAALGNVGQSSYSTAKAGLQGFTRTLALELGRFNITVNAVAPGFTVTDMTREVAERVGVPFEQMLIEQARAIAVGRAGQPEDIANAVSFFADRRSGFVSGQVLYVAGGPCG